MSGIYNSDGSIAITVVDGTTYTGVYSPPGSVNVVLDDTAHTGIYHPCGAFRVNSSYGDTVYDPSGAFYINNILGSRGHARPINLLQQSGDFDLWTNLAFTVTSNAANDPVFNTLTAERLTETATLNQHNITPTSINFTTGVTYTFSVYAKYETTPYIQLLLGSAAFGGNAWGNFNIQTGTLGTIGSDSTATIIYAGNSWYRCCLTATATSTAASPTVIFGANASNMSRALSYTGSTSNTRLLADAQVETGPIANPYSPT